MSTVSLHSLQPSYLESKDTPKTDEILFHITRTQTT